MSVGKLQKFLQKPLDVQGKQEKTVLVVGDSKACRLQSVADYPPCDKIVWWTRPGMTMAEAEQTLRTHFPTFAVFKRVHVYVWAGTCDLTVKDRKELSLRTLFDEEEQVRLFDKMRSVCNSRRSPLTILEVPYYSVQRWNDLKAHIKTPDLVDLELQERVDSLNTRIRTFNESSGVRSPQFGCDLERARGRRGKTVYSLNFNLLVDGIHPDLLLCKVWMRSIALMIAKDCFTKAD